MTKTLFLLRHAKAVPGDAYPDDHARPLNARGHEAIAAIGSYLATSAHAPETIIASTAQRTQETAQGMAEQLGIAEDSILSDRHLYLASAGSLLRTVNELDDSCNDVMLVGHNPGMHNIAVQLTGRGEDEALKNLQINFPTAALAVLQFEEDSWADIGPGSGTLIEFMTPKMLE